MEKIDNFVKTNMPFITENNFTVGGSIVLLVYALLIAPNLSTTFAALFDNVFFRLLIFISILILIKYNPVVAIIATIGVVISLIKLNTYKMNRELMSIASHEFEADRRSIMAQSLDAIPTVYETADERYPDTRFHVPSEITGYRPRQHLAPIVAQEAPKAEEEKVSIVLNKIEEQKKALGRELTPEEINKISQEAEYSLFATVCEDENCVDDISLLQCSGREPSTFKLVTGHDPLVGNFAAPDM